MAVNTNAVLAQCALDVRIAGNRGGFVQAVPIHVRGAAALDQIAQDFEGIALTHMQLGILRAQPVVECRQ